MTQSITRLATNINELCDYDNPKHNYFFGYGLVKETVKLWNSKTNRTLLNETANYMVWQITGKRWQHEQPRTDWKQLHSAGTYKKNRSGKGERRMSNNIVKNILNCVSDHHKELEKIDRQKQQVIKEMKLKSKGIENTLNIKLKKIFN